MALWKWARRQGRDRVREREREKDVMKSAGALKREREASK